MRADIASRFTAKIETSASGCHVWTAARDNDGYGLFKARGRAHRAHRFAYEFQRGPIPKGLVIDHLCRNRACVNVEHLRVVTRRENTLADGSEAVSKRHSEKTHCPRGHAYVPSNLIAYSTISKRTCKTCNRARQRKNPEVQGAA